MSHVGRGSYTLAGVVHPHTHHTYLTTHTHNVGTHSSIYVVKYIHT